MSKKENPIDKDKTTDTPSLLPYAHHVGSAIIRPMDKGKQRGLAMKAMYQQTELQLNQIKEQVESLIRQAQKIHDRIDYSEMIYQAEIGFKPLIGQHYYLYQRSNDKYFVSMIGPNEWRKKEDFEFKTELKLLADHTWQVVE